MTADYDFSPAVPDGNLFSVAKQWFENGHRIVFAIVIETWGSSPREMGSIMLVRDDQTTEGSVSGGCVEGAVVDAALKIMDSKGSRKLDFGVADSDAWEVGLSCGGEISVWLVSVADGYFSPGLLFDAEDAICKRKRIGLRFELETGKVQMISSPPLKSCFEKMVFTLVKKPRPQLVIVGAVHISQHLAVIAIQLGFDVKVIDPRGIFATGKQFPGIAIYHCWPDEIFGKMVFDQETALVTLTHDPKIDDMALHLGLVKPLFYVACLGSKKTHLERLNRLTAAGFSTDVTSHIFGPAGIDIDAKTPAEIAVSIAAELVSAYRKSQGEANAAK